MEKLYRSKTDSKIAGICGGVGEMLHVDPTIIRLIFIFAAIMTVVFPFVLVYIAGWLMIPEGAVKNAQVKDPE